MSLDLLEEHLVFNLKAAKQALKRHQERKQEITQTLQDNEPHVEEDDEGEKDQEEQPKKKKPRTAPSGPCEGRIWLSPAEDCPGAEEGRGKNPEADAKIFARAVYDRKRHTLCKSCKNEYNTHKSKNKTK